MARNTSSSSTAKTKKPIRYLWCHAHSRPRKFWTDGEYHDHLQKWHPEDAKDFFPLAKYDSTVDVTVERSVTCDYGNCTARFQTVDSREEHKRRFHAELW